MIQSPTYLLSTPSNLKRNNQIKVGENIKVINNSIMFNDVFDRLTAEKEEKFTNYNHFQIIVTRSKNSLVTSEAIDKIIEFYGLRVLPLT
jgi:hypothetical protein